MSIIKKNLTEIFILLVVLILLLHSSDPVIYSDSNRYLNKSLHDPPLYSRIIQLIVFIFGNLNSIIIFQSLLIVFSIFYFSKTLMLHFNLDIITKSIVILFLFLPILQFYDHLLTEPISYAFSIFFVSYVVKLIYNLNIQNIVFYSIFVILLLLTRNQFMFLYPVVLLLYFGVFYLYCSKRTLNLLLISFISIFLTSQFFNLFK